MYMAAFALLSAIGTCIAWRNNPMYSNRSTLRFVVVVGLAVAAAIGAIVAVVDIFGDRPESVALTAILGTTFFCTIFLIWVIVKVTMPPPGPIPANAQLVRVHRAALAPWAIRYGWMVLGLALLAIVLPSSGKDVVYAIGGLFVGLGAIMLFTGYFAASGLDRSLTSVEANPWVHWRYTAEQWKAWTDVEVSRVETSPKQSALRAYPKRVALMLILIGIGMFAFNPGPWLFDAGCTVASWALIAGIIVLANRSDLDAGRRLRKVLMKAAPEAYFGPAGLFVDGSYMQWLTVSDYLIDASIDERNPRSLAFAFVQIVAGAGANTALIRKNVLIPNAAEADLARLQAALSAACPNARIALA